MRHEAALTRRDLPWLAGATLAGGVIGPVLLMPGLVHISASSASLLLNLEGVFTALLAWSVFRENFNRRIALGMPICTTITIATSMTFRGTAPNRTRMFIATRRWRTAIRTIRISITGMGTDAMPVRP